MKKITILFLLIFNSTVFTVFGQDFTREINFADSLFKEKKFIEAKTVYTSILQDGAVYSDAMLLKMAYIHEGMGEKADALYYLNLYYISTLDEAVLKKMDRLSESAGLTGYEFGEAGYFINLYKQNNQYFLLALYGLLFIQLGFILYRRIAHKKQPLVAGLFFLFYASFIYYLNNFDVIDKNAVVYGDYNYLMSGPSQASEVLKVLPKGHRIEIEESDGSWTKIEFQNEYYYIKNDRLRKFHL